MSWSLVRQLNIFFLTCLTLASSSQFLPADDIEWFSLSLPQQASKRFRLEKTESIKVFTSSQNGRTSYDITLIDEYRGMVRLDTATGEHWELLPREFDRKADMQTPFFEMIADNRKGLYLGKVFYPNGGDHLLIDHRSGPAIYDRAVPFPVRGGFKGVFLGFRNSKYDSTAYQFQANRQLGDVQATQINLGQFGDEAASERLTYYDGRFWTRASDLCAISDDYYLLDDRNQILCWKFGGNSFTLPGVLSRLVRDWGDELAAAPLPNSKAIVVVYEKGLLHYDGQKRLVPFPDGWSAGNRRKRIKFTDQGSRVAILMRGPEDQRELWDFDSKTLKLLGKLSLNAAEFSASFKQQSGVLAVQTTDKANANLLLFELRKDEQPVPIGKTSPLTAAVSRAQCWNLSDDGQSIFFVSRPERNESIWKLGRISIDSLGFETAAGKAAAPIAPGFSTFSQDQMSFEELPTDATETIVGTLPKAEKWSTISPNDRWVAGVNRSDLQLFDTVSRKLHVIPDLGSDVAVAFSADSSLLAIFRFQQVQVWNVGGEKPIMVASTDNLPKEVRADLGSVVNKARQGACFVSADSVAATNFFGSIRFRLNGQDLEITHKSDLKGRYAAYSPDGSALLIWKEDGAIWRYQWTGAEWKGVAKVKVPHFEQRVHGRQEFHSMSTETDRLVIYSSDGLTAWDDLKQKDKLPFTTVGQKPNLLGISTLMDRAAISRNQQWVAYLRENDDGCELTLLDSKMKKVAGHQLPIEIARYSSRLFVTNDGQHAIVQSPVNNSPDHYYVIRLQAK